MMPCRICGFEVSPHLSGLYDDRFGAPGTFDIFRCDGCGCFSTWPQPPERDLPELYASYYPPRRLVPADVAAVARGDLRRLRARLLTCLRGNRSAHDEVEPGARVLDYGCGPGVSLLEITAGGGEGWGIEFDRNVAPLAQQLGLRVHVGPLATHPTPDGFFDAVTLSQVLEHVPDPLSLLTDLGRKVRPGGWLALTTPNADGVLRRALGRRWLHWHVPYHLHHFSEQALRQLVARAGFRDARLRTFTPLAWCEYQAELLIGPGSPGLPNPAFEGGRLRRTATRAKLLWLGKLLTLPLVRAVDSVGLGDSWLLTARRAS